MWGNWSVCASSAFFPFSKLVFLDLSNQLDYSTVFGNQQKCLIMSYLSRIFGAKIQIIFFDKNTYVARFARQIVG